MSQSSPLSLSVGGTHGAAEPVFTISGPANAGIAAALLPDGFASGGTPPVFTISGPGNAARMRALEQRCEDLRIEVARLSRS